MVLRSVSVAALCGALLSPIPALAQQADGAGGSGGEQAAASAQPEGPLTPPYEKKLREGMEAYVRGDHAAARAAFLEAVNMEPSRAEGYYYLGVAQRAEGDLLGAAQSFRNALQRAEAKGEAAMALRARMGIADVAERSLRPAQPSDTGRPVVDTEGLDRVQTEWRSLRSAFEAREEEQWMQVAEARAQAAFRVLEQDEAYVQVRRRIAEREREKAEEERQGSRRRRGRR